MSTVDWPWANDGEDGSQVVFDLKKSSITTSVSTVSTKQRKRSEKRSSILPPISSSETKMVQDLSNMTIVESSYRKVSQVCELVNIPETIKSDSLIAKWGS